MIASCTLDPSSMAFLYDQFPQGQLIPVLRLLTALSTVTGKPSLLASCAKTASPIGLRQMLPKQTTRTDTGLRLMLDIDRWRLRRLWRDRERWRKKPGRTICVRTGVIGVSQRDNNRGSSMDNAYHVDDSKIIHHSRYQVRRRR